MLFRLLYRTKHRLERALPTFPSLSISAAARVGAAMLGVALPLCGVPAGAATQACPATTFEGEVAQGQSYVHPLTPSLEFKLEAVPAGWMVRVLPQRGPRPLHDAAELANPPYRSPTPILISTDFAFRAQDAIAWNPRNFLFFTTAPQVAAAEAAYQATLRDPTHPAAGAALYPLLANAAQARLTFLDAAIVGGTANQTAAAATVATHFAETAHTVRTDVAPTPLGAILRLRFRVSIPATAPCR